MQKRIQSLGADTASKIKCKNVTYWCKQMKLVEFMALTPTHNRCLFTFIQKDRKTKKAGMCDSDISASLHKIKILFVEKPSSSHPAAQKVNTINTQIQEGNKVLASHSDPDQRGLLVHLLSLPLVSHETGCI